MKNDQFVPSYLTTKECTDIHIQDDLFSVENKTIARLIEENEEKEKNLKHIPPSG